jgi:2-C-methyl-D-erythritol 4-phosphate cytidylyltransferase/2-C-methyl-D-erythritol 2,4-cyclodiphosphate synthase
MHVAAIIAAGGRGARLGANVPKQLLALGGKSLLQRSFETIAAHEAVKEIVLAVPSELLANPPAFLHCTHKPVLIIEGGRRRQDSVARAFDHVSEGAALIVVHDAARPLASADLFTRVIDAARESGAAIAAIQSRDTVKLAAPASSEYVSVERTLARAQIYLAQTPQAFSRHVLIDAIALGQQGGEATDEASLAEQAGHSVRLVEGEPSNIKITTEDDLRMAQGLVDSRESTVESRESLMRIGTGYDLHRLELGRPLVIGGVAIPHEAGLVGHSDADVLSHAIIDAILGAAAAGDIGRHFPDTDPLWKGASSIDLLRRAAEIVREAGHVVSNVDAVIIAERPKLAPHIPAMRERLAAAMDIDPSQVSVKGKTNEGVGELGRGEAIAVHAIAMIESAG